MAEKDTHDVEVAHAFSASPEQVYDAWLVPDLVQRWFGPGLGETLPVEVDARVGGRFRIVQMRDGQPVGHSGEYLILEGKRCQGQFLTRMTLASERDPPLVAWASWSIQDRRTNPRPCADGLSSVLRAT